MCLPERNRGFLIRRRTSSSAWTGRRPGSLWHRSRAHGVSAEAHCAVFHKPLPRKRHHLLKCSPGGDQREAGQVPGRRENPEPVLPHARFSRSSLGTPAPAGAAEPGAPPVTISLNSTPTTAGSRKTRDCPDSHSHSHRPGRPHMARVARSSGTVNHMVKSRGLIQLPPREGDVPAGRDAA